MKNQLSFIYLSINLLTFPEVYTIIIAVYKMTQKRIIIMNIDFENYEYDDAWFGKEEVSFNGHTYEVDVQIDSDDE